MANVNSGTVTPLPDPTNQGAVSYCYVVAGQSLEVSVSATVDGAFLTDSTWFNVSAPNPTTPAVSLPFNAQLSVDYFTDCSQNPPAPNSLPSLCFGNISGPDCITGFFAPPAGILFTPPTASTPAGRFFFVQLVTGDQANHYYPEGGRLHCVATPGLDGAYPYQGRFDAPVADAPFVPLPALYSRVSRGFGATMYLMWQSNISGAIPVPIGSVNWSFSGQTIQSNGTWTTPTGSGFADSFAAASDINSFPQWTGLAILPDQNCQDEE